VVRATGQRFGCNMISAITNRGELSFMVFEGTFKNATFIEFMKRMLKQATRKIYLIVDGHPVHRSVAVKQFVADNANRLRLIRLPGYCPELNPYELLNQDVKTNALGKSRPTTKPEMTRRKRRTMVPPHHGPLTTFPHSNDRGRLDPRPDSERLAGVLQNVASVFS
jgi:transposase